MTATEAPGNATHRPGFSKEPIPDGALYRDDGGSPTFGTNATPATSGVATGSTAPRIATPFASAVVGAPTRCVHALVASRHAVGGVVRDDNW
jgi:hypothetical protein